MEETRDPRSIMHQEGVFALLRNYFQINNLPYTLPSMRVLRPIVEEYMPVYETGRNRTHVGGQVKEQDLAILAFDSFLKQFGVSCFKIIQTQKGKRAVPYVNLEDEEVLKVLRGISENS
jgi:UDP-N-acetylglucosamine pyrophosphorylase